MSGVRRKSKFRKGVEREILEDLPQLAPGTLVARVVASRGGNLVEVETVDPEGKLVSGGLCRLPARFRNLVFVKRGSLLIVETSGDETIQTASGEAGKVVFNVQSVVFGEAQIQHLRSTGNLPKLFDAKAGEEKKGSEQLAAAPPASGRSNYIDAPVRALDSESSDEEEDENEEDAEAVPAYPAPKNRNRAPIAYYASSSSEEEEEEEEAEEDGAAEEEAEPLPAN